jgi:thiamine pyrophosphate-dependent acetolactate synthase large subunit-like protein
MTKPGDLQTKKTLRELAKEFPEKTYRELEKYRDADRNEEAQRIITQQENEELKEDQLKESWKDKYDLEHRLRQEAETETILIKGIGMNSPEMKAANKKMEYLQNELDRVKRENNDLHNKVAALLDAVDPAVQIQKARESGL